MARRQKRRPPRQAALLVIAALAAAAVVGGAVHGRATATEDDAPARLARDPVARAAADAIEEGRETFRFDTFGSEAFWGGQLRLHGSRRVPRDPRRPEARAARPVPLGPHAPRQPVRVRDPPALTGVPEGLEAARARVAGGAVGDAADAREDRRLLAAVRLLARHWDQVAHRRGGRGLAHHGRRHAEGAPRPQPGVHLPAAARGREDRGAARRPAHGPRRLHEGRRGRRGDGAKRASIPITTGNSYSASGALWAAADAVEIGGRLGPFDASLIEVGAYDALWADVHLGPEQAIEAHRLVHGGVLIPVHWGTFDLALHPWTEPVERLLVAASNAGVRLAMPRPGETIAPVTPPPAVRWWPDVPSRTAQEAPVVSTGLEPGRGLLPRASGG
jgi:hypothetical protein